MRRCPAALAAIAATALSAAFAPAVFGDDIEPLTTNASGELGASEGHLALVFDSLNTISNVRFTARGEYAVKFALPDVPVGIHLFVLRLPAGSYCLSSLRAGKVRYNHRSDSEGTCMKLGAGELVYPGHFAPRADGERDGIMHIELKPAEFLQRMAQEFPTVLAVHDDS